MCVGFLHSGLCCGAGNVHIALRERVDGHGLTPVEQVRGKLQDLAERDVCIQWHILQTDKHHQHNYKK